MPIPLMAIFAGTSALSLGGKLFGAYQSSKASANAAQAARIEGEMARLRGTQIGELSREQLRQTLGTIDAIRSARGVNLDSPTSQVIEAKTMKDALRDEMIARLGELTRAAASDAQARGYARASKWAVPLAAVGGIADIGADYIGLQGAMKAKPSGGG